MIYRMLDGYSAPLFVLAGAGIMMLFRWRLYPRRGRKVSIWSDIIIAVAIIALSAGLMLAMGRTPIYKYGTVRLWSGNVNSDQNSQQIADQYTFTHIIHGFVFYGILRFAAPQISLGLRAVIAIAAESAWEVLENTDMVISRYREATISLDYYGDSVINSVFDILAALLGFFLAARLSTRTTIILLIVIEIALLFWIRDNLTLNIIMLIYPFEAIKIWQIGG